MPMTPAERRKLREIRAARAALVKAYDQVSLVRRRLAKLGSIARVTPGFPPNFPESPCGPIPKKPGPPKPITLKRYRAALSRIEDHLKNAIRVFNKMYPPRTARR